MNTDLVPSWIRDAQRAEAEHREAVLDDLTLAFSRFVRGVVTVDEYVTQVNRIAG